MYAFGQKETFIIFVLVQTRVNFLNELQESTKRVLPRAQYPLVTSLTWEKVNKVLVSRGEGEDKILSLHCSDPKGNSFSFRKLLKEKSSKLKEFRFLLKLKNRTPGGE